MLHVSMSEHLSSCARTGTWRGATMSSRKTLRTSSMSFAVPVCGSLLEGY